MGSSPYSEVRGDITRNKHHDEPQSVLAFEGIAAQLTEDEEEYLRHVRSFGAKGTTNAEVAALMKRKQHAVSGRRSKLLADGLIVKTGESRRWCGTPGGVVVAAEFWKGKK